MRLFVLLPAWIQHHRWLLLLTGIFMLLIISPFSEIYDRQDNLITPLAALVIIAVTLSTARRLLTFSAMLVLTVTWLLISLFTEGSGIFAGISIVAPVLFLVVMGAVFLLLAGWLARVNVINFEVLCAAICGYLILGLFWAGLYAVFQTMDPHAIASNNGARMGHGDFLYFSFTTLTTTGFGDMTPHNPFARMWTVIEAVVGTFYNAIVIARLVALYGFKVLKGA